MFVEKKSKIFLCISIVLMLFSGGVMAKDNYKSVGDVKDSDWEKLSGKRIYFGHQSVGYNIIDGVNDLMKKHQNIRLTIKETSNASDFNDGIFGHGKIGKNKQPKSKIDAFGEYMDGGLGGNADIAFMKFCYVDFTTSTDIKEVFRQYTESMSRLKEKYPATTFIHLTVPYTVVKTSWKTWLKELLGKSIWEFEGNIVKYQFNEMIRNHYKDREPVFDFAKIESTSINGTRVSFTKDDKTYYSLDPAYASDEGHLNETGRQIAAEKLLLFLLDQI